MRKLSLESYQFGSEIYDVKQSIINILFLPQLKLNMKQVIENDRISRKIEVAKEIVLLEEAEYQVIREIIETFEGYGRQDVVFINRILNVPEIQVGEIADD
jgi:hypothetical protein